MSGTPPVIELIVMSVVDTLWRLNETDYSFQPADVVRRLNPDVTQPRDGLIVVEQDQQEEIVGYTDGNVCLVDKTQIINIGVFCMPELGEYEPIDPFINQRASDVWRVLMDQTYDGNGSTRFGGQALNSSRCLGVQPMLLPDGAFAGFLIPLEVHYRHKDNDPTFNGV